MRIYFHSDSSKHDSEFALTVTVMAQNQVSYVFDNQMHKVAVQKDSTILLAYYEEYFDTDTKEFLCWQIGDDTYDEGDEYYIIEDITGTAVTRLMPTATLEGNGATVIGYPDVTEYGPSSFSTGTTAPLPHANMIFDFPRNKYFGGWRFAV